MGRTLGPTGVLAAAMATVVALIGGIAAADEITLGDDGLFRVSGKPFLPVMALNQPTDTWADLAALGVNTFVAESRPTPQTTVKQYLEAAEKLKVYVVLPPAWIEQDGAEAAAAVAASQRVLAIGYGGRPDRMHAESEARVEAAEARVDPERPLGLLFDDDPNTWTILEPVRGFALTVRVSESAMRRRGPDLEPPVVTRVAVMQRDAAGFLSQPRTVQILDDGRELVTIELKNADGVLQKFDLPKPTAVRSLTAKVLAVHEGRDPRGAWSELQLLAADGTNVLASPVRYVSEGEADAVAAECLKLRGQWKRPVLVTTTPAFARLPLVGDMPHSPGRAYYQRALSECDAAMTTLLPLDSGGRPVTLDAALLQQLTDLGARPKCLGVWMAAGLPHPERAVGGARAASPMELRANVLLSLVNGARMVPYVTQRLTAGNTAAVDIPEGNRAEMKRLAAVLPRLAEILAMPAGEGPSWDIAMGQPAAVFPPRWQMVRRGPDGSRYLWVVNPTSRTAEATLDLAGGSIAERLFDDATVPVASDGRTARVTLPPWYAEVCRVARSGQ